mgnify:CR=1 FL=1
MNKALLMGIMRMHNDTQKDLADALGLSLSRLNAKINEKYGAQFNQTEIASIKCRYKLDDTQLNSIFFASIVS